MSQLFDKTQEKGTRASEFSKNGPPNDLAPILPAWFFPCICKIAAYLPTYIHALAHAILLHWTFFA
jgi:hypothetical protein